MNDMIFYHDELINSSGAVYDGNINGREFGIVPRKRPRVWVVTECPAKDAASGTMRLGGKDVEVVNIMVLGELL